jgi:hypothetical protein
MESLIVDILKSQVDNAPMLAVLIWIIWKQNADVRAMIQASQDMFKDCMDCLKTIIDHD